MFAVIMYDIPSDEEGTKRRTKVHNLLLKYGYHVQNSAFELTVDYGKLLTLIHEISKIIDNEVDSVRLYKLGAKRTSENVVLIGKREYVETSDNMIEI